MLDNVKVGGGAGAEHLPPVFINLDYFGHSTVRLCLPGRGCLAATVAAHQLGDLPQFFKTLRLTSRPALYMSEISAQLTFITDICRSKNNGNMRIEPLSRKKKI